MRDVDRWLGRELTFNRRDRCGTVRTPITVAAFDPALGVRLWSRFMEAAWVPTATFDRLLQTGVLEEPSPKFEVIV